MVERIHKIQEKLDLFEGAIIRSDANRFYLTGFNSSAGIVLVFKNAAYFLIDFRYFEIAEKSVAHLKTVLLKNTFAQINELCKENSIKKLYTECDNIDLNSFFAYKNGLECELSDDNKIGELLLKLRSNKDEKEISLIKKAQGITDDTFSYILNEIAVGKTEKEIALQMEFYLRKQGSEGVSFDFIVVSGKNSSLPHGVPTDKKIEKGDFVTMDFGAVFGGYRSDMTRTVCVGSPSDAQKEVYNAVLKAQNIAFVNIKPNVKCLDVDKAARGFIESKYDGCFGHGLGHSVGIEIHENPSFNTKCETPLEKGMVLTVEPGIYLKNEFGVRIEDMVVITENGFENITKSPKDLIIL